MQIIVKSKMFDKSVERCDFFLTTFKPFFDEGKTS